MHFLDGHITVKCKPNIEFYYFLLYINCIQCGHSTINCTKIGGLISLVLKYIYFYLIFCCYTYFGLYCFLYLNCLFFMFYYPNLFTYINICLTDSRTDL